MSFAVVLNEIGMNPEDEIIDHLFGHIAAEDLVVFVRMQVEVETEERFAPKWARLCDRTGGRGGGGGEKGSPGDAAHAFCNHCTSLSRVLHHGHVNSTDTARPAVVTLTTDFGTTDHFAGVMKGVILGIAPHTAIVDITHEITPFAISEAGFVVSQTYPYFPPGTVHVVVVDPGVGSSRRAIVVEAAGQLFVGPDNGLFSMLYSREQCKVRVISNSEFFLDAISQTFHGRDIFAPVAAHLAAGAKPDQVGGEIDDYHRSMTGAVPERTGKRIWTGAILKIDRFGNIITNFRADDLPDLTLHPFEMQVGFQKIDSMARSYADAKQELFAIIGSSGYIEVSANQQPAAKVLGVGVGAPVELTLY